MPKKFFLPSTLHVPVHFLFDRHHEDKRKVGPPQPGLAWDELNKVELPEPLGYRMAKKLVNFGPR